MNKDVLPKSSKGYFNVLTKTIFVHLNFKIYLTKFYFILQEIEKMIDTLDADELDALEEILSKPLDEETELKMIQVYKSQLTLLINPLNTFDIEYKLNMIQE